jgi:hypothetical protein
LSEEVKVKVATSVAAMAVCAGLEKTRLRSRVRITKKIHFVFI